MNNPLTFDNAFRTQLVAFARRHSPHDAEDRAQEAMLAALEKRARDPAQYAYAVVGKLAKRARRIPQRAFFDSLHQPLPGADEVLDTAQKLGRVDAALEQILVWADGSATHLRVRSFTNLDLLGILASLRSATSVFDVLPASDRHRRRKRGEFEAHLQAAYGRCTCEVDASVGRRAAGPRAGAEGPVEENGVEAGEDEPEVVTCLRILDPCLNRAFWTVNRYGPPRAPIEDCLSLAFEAVQHATRSLEGAG